ncbi:MAG: hypothetical protein U0802_11340 [Candidatus Binatia bacterium]
MRSAVVTEVLRPRAADAAAVAGAFAATCPAIAEPDPARAWSAACRLAGGDGAVVATGSLFLIGALHELGVTAAGETRGAAHP